MVMDSPVSRDRDLDSHPEGKSCVDNRIRAEIKNHTWETPVVGLENSTPVIPQDLHCSPSAESYQAVPDSNPYTGSSLPKEKPHFLRIPGLNIEPPDQIIVHEPQAIRL